MYYLSWQCIPSEENSLRPLHVPSCQNKALCLCCLRRWILAKANHGSPHCRNSWGLAQRQSQGWVEVPIERKTRSLEADTHCKPYQKGSWWAIKSICISKKKVGTFGHVLDLKFQTLWSVRFNASFIIEVCHKHVMLNVKFKYYAKVQSSIGIEISPYIIRLIRYVKSQ